jgi:hypothetical protein
MLVFSSHEILNRLKVHRQRVCFMISIFFYYWALYNYFSNCHGEYTYSLKILYLKKLHPN